MLMRDAQAGDAAAYRRLLTGILPFVRALARRQVSYGPEADDIVQDVLLTLHRVRHTYDPERPFSPWLAAIVVRRGIDAMRRQQRVDAHEVVDDAVYLHASETFAAPEANRELEQQDLETRLTPLLEALPARQRHAFEMLKLRELTLAEAAAESGMTVGALKVAVHRAVHALRAALGAPGLDG